MTDYKALYEAQLEKNKELLNSKNDLYNELEELTQKYETLKEENKSLMKAEIRQAKTHEKLEKENNVRKDIIYNLFSQRLCDDDVLDDGIDLSKEYGQKYIDEWNKIHEEIFDDVVNTMNMSEYDFEHFHIEYNGDTHFDLCMNESDDEEEEEEE